MALEVPVEVGGSMLSWFISHLPAEVGILFGVLGVVLLLWSWKPIAGSKRAKWMSRSRVVRRLDAMFNRAWQAAIPVAFAVATGLIGLGLGSAVDRFGPESDKRPTGGYYEEFLWIAGGAAVLALGLGAAFWRGRVNREQGLGTAIMIDERLEVFDPNEHGAFAHAVRSAFHTTIELPHPEPDHPVWQLAGQDWGDRVARLMIGLRVVLQLDRPDTPTSLFIKAPWALSMAVGNRLHGAGSEGTSLRVRPFPPDDRVRGLPQAKALRAALESETYFTFGQENPGSDSAATANWLTVSTGDGHATAETCLVVAIRVPTNRLGVLPEKDSPTDTHLPGPFIVVDRGRQLPATHILEVEVAEASAGHALAHLDLLGYGYAVHEALWEALQGRAAELDLAQLSADGRIYLATTLVGELALTMGWLFNSRRPGSELQLKPLVFGKGQLTAAPGLTISLRPPPASLPSQTT